MSSEVHLEYQLDLDMDLIAQNVRNPGIHKGPEGDIVKVYLARNIKEEENAARLCEIQPHHRVLELGFGLGHGLREALRFIKVGTGTLSGVDISEEMLLEANQLLMNEIKENPTKIDLRLANVDSMPFPDNYFDRVFHCNCYYFWSDFVQASKEIFRVMKDKAVMVTVFKQERLDFGKDKGSMKYGNPDHEKYMTALNVAGFTNVRMVRQADEPDYEYQAIFASVNK